jgi:hypothetical protein
VPICTGFPHWRQSLFQKHKYIRSKKLLQLVSELDCQMCGKGGGCQAAHTNWGGHKGRGVKADDNLVAALCQMCHHEIDQGAKLSRQERQEMWQSAHDKTVSSLVDSGRWPPDVPIPKG